MGGVQIRPNPLTHACRRATILAMNGITTPLPLIEVARVRHRPCKLLFAGRPYVVWRDGERYQVTSALCPHRGTDLSAGTVCAGKPTCPEWHERHGETPLDPIPDRMELEHLISTCYQASLMREEERPVRFRLILRDPAGFPPEQGPPDGFHRIIFTTPRPFNENELLRSSWGFV